MTPDELSKEVKRVMERAQSRVGSGSVGEQQYSEGVQKPQKFETMSLDGLFEYWQEEVDDMINYAVMMSIRIDRMRAHMNSLVTLVEELEDGMRDHQPTGTDAVQREEQLPLGAQSFTPVSGRDH